MMGSFRITNLCSFETINYHKGVIDNEVLRISEFCQSFKC